MSQGGVKILGHRGATGLSCPENSAQAITQAAQWGFDGVEIDVGLTKDNQLLCWHDATINGIAIHELSWQQAQSMLSYPALSLEEALRLTERLNLFLMCEIKVYHEPSYRQLLDRVKLEFASRRVPTDRFLISSFHQQTIQDLLVEWPQVTCAFASEEGIIPEGLGVDLLVHPASVTNTLPGVSSIIYDIKAPNDYVQATEGHIYALVVDQA